MKKFDLDKRDAMVFGVCSGIARYTGLGVTLVRILAVVFTILGGFPWTLAIYAAIAWIARPTRIAGQTASESDRLAAGPRSGLGGSDRRRAEVASYVSNPNSRLAREIEELR